jgi:hypothetical protein
VCSDKKKEYAVKSSLRMRVFMHAKPMQRYASVC